METASACTGSSTPRVRGAPKKFKRIPAIDLINSAVATDWKQLERATIPASRPTKKARNALADGAARFTSNLWAYIQSPVGVSSTGAAAVEAKAVQENDPVPAPSIKGRERSCKAVKAAAGASKPVGGKGDAAAKCLEPLFGKLNERSHLFTFARESSSSKLSSVLDSELLSHDRSGLDSQYSNTTLEECERFSPYYADSIGSDVSCDLDDPKPVVSDEAVRDLCQRPLDALRCKCEKFFEHHGLVVKVRKLPVEGSVRRSITVSPHGATREQLSYPSYHFISRQHAHMFEQVMRGRTFLDTRYNSCNEMRNAKSPFSLFELHDGVLKHLEGLRDDLCDPEFSGIFISLSTRAFVSDSEFGRVRRTKTIAWAMIELLTSNERCLRGLWVHPAVSAPATTSLLSALLPYSIMTSFLASPNVVDDRYPVKTFCTWLTDFDTFPRQSLVLLASVERFGLIKHYDAVDVSSRYAPYGSSSGSGLFDSQLSHVDVGVADEKCFCYAGAKWDDLAHVIVGCTEQLMHNVLPKWLKLVPDAPLPDLLDDLERVVMPDSVSFNPTKPKDGPNAVRDAEYAGLSPLEVKDLLVHLYGARWRNRLKIHALKCIRDQHMVPKPCTSEVLSMFDEREERRKRRAQMVGQV
ncbi:erythrocyte membrane pfemp3, related protein [Babesia caballi]|uniref:Erythrocyte membrane pfemp3, related protein n=1 Tax=Babesia caballi TaxID=5871 RepID=A0AAV4M0Q2_BABCB|nr:erythrocyte membrane pfemp3, related protein [Babesia caballi]